MIPNAARTFRIRVRRKKKLAIKKNVNPPADRTTGAFIPEMKA